MLQRNSEHFEKYADTKFIPKYGPPVTEALTKTYASHFIKYSERNFCVRLEN